MCKLYCCLFESCPLCCNLITLCVKATTHVHLVRQVELVALLGNQAVPLIGLLLELSPSLNFLWRVQIERGFFLYRRQELGVQAHSDLVLLVQYVQAQVTRVTVLLTQH